MKIRLTGRHDGLLFAGVALALLTVFDQTVGWFLQLASSVDSLYHLRLIPALGVLVAVYIVHLLVRREEMKAAAAAAATDAKVARDRARDLEQLSQFGRSLAASLTTETLGATLWRHLPTLAERRDLWVALGDGQTMTLLVETTGNPSVASAAEEIARRVVAGRNAAAADSNEGIRDSRHLCFVISAACRPLGVLGVVEDSAVVGERQERMLAAAAALLGIAVKNVQLFNETRENALTDSLTMCFNRGHVLQVIASELRRARRSRSSVSVIMLDIDQFKSINDRVGHLSADRVLAAIGGRLKDVLRVSDVRGRFGGDEFLIVLPETPAAGAIHVAEALRREIESLRVAVDDGIEAVTASIGVATSTPEELEVDALVSRADRALYRAKDGGRNRVEVAESPVVSQEPTTVRRAG
jgi:diguanylate cyclase (GGDEF)-like protein